MKTPKSNLLFLIITIMLLCFSVHPIFAQSRFIDEVGLIHLEQTQILEEKLAKTRQRHLFDLVILVIDQLNYKEAHIYAADFFEENGFGSGVNRDGAILLLAMEDREMGFATFGLGVDAFTAAGQDYLDKLFLPQITAGQYFEGFLAYTEAVDDFLVKWEEGIPYDAKNIPLLPSERRRYQFYSLLGSLIGSLALAFIVTGVQKGKLTSRREDQFAHNYVRKGSMVLDVQRDIFLYRNVHREKKVEKNKEDRSFSTSSGNSGSGHSKKF